MKSIHAIPAGTRFRIPRESMLATLFCVAICISGVVGRAEAAPAEHEAAACSACHGARGQALAKDSAEITNACLACHAAEFQGGGPAMHTVDTRRCLVCHSFHAGEGDGGSELDASFASLETTRFSDHCQGCHANGGALSNLSPGHRAAAALYHREGRTLSKLSVSGACLLCHGDTPSKRWIRDLDEEPIPLNRHASHPFGIVLSPGDATAGMPVRRVADPRIPLFSGRMECTSCHLLSVAEDDLLRPFRAKYDLCLGCHERGGGNRNDTGSLPVAWAGVGAGR